MAKDAAAKLGLDSAWICAVIEQESGWKPNAFRYEPAFQMRYVAGLGLDPAETYKRSCSYGLLQIMGQVARELSFHGDLDGLFDPQTNLEYGCRHFRNKLNHAADTHEALQHWNGGGNPHYADQVLARVDKYR